MFDTLPSKLAVVAAIIDTIIAFVSTAKSKAKPEVMAYSSIATALSGFLLAYTINCLALGGCSILAWIWTFFTCLFAAIALFAVFVMGKFAI